MDKGFHHSYRGLAVTNSMVTFKKFLVRER